ncbi:hypothetical protein NL676_002903 [Syzygium grande]|nr:hypothetical protein NL676_002903 [Syzygium grande]
MSEIKVSGSFSACELALTLLQHPLENTKEDGTSIQSIEIQETATPRSTWVGGVYIPSRSATFPVLFFGFSEALIPGVVLVAS